MPMQGLGLGARTRSICALAGRYGILKPMKHYIVYPILLLVVIGAGCATGTTPPRQAKATKQTMMVTGYCKCGECCNWKRSFFGRPVFASGPKKGDRKQIGLTASGTQASVGTIAADTSLYPFGTVMHIPGYGYGRVEDRGGDIKGQHIDLFFKSHKKALEWGRQNKQVTIWKAQAGAKKRTRVGG